MVGADSRRVFETVLSREAERHEAALGGNIEKHVHATTRLLIGQLAWDLGVVGWQAWREAGNAGCAWAGVCEDELAFGETEGTVRSVLASVESPERLRVLAGRFAVCAWDDAVGGATLATGATGTVTLWYTSGPEGWACGSRVGPLLRLIDRNAELDHESAKLFLAYGYHVGAGCFFAKVRRLRARTRVVFDDSDEPRIDGYASIPELLVGEEPEPDVDRAAARGAARLIDRVTWQLARSSTPVVHLSGGHDSRAITAAAARSGFQGRIVTGGPGDSIDVRVAADVTDRLGLAHASKASEPRSELSLEESEAWVRLTDGVAVLRHHSFPRFGTGRAARPRQIFHGLGGEICRGYYYAGATGLDAAERGNGRKVIEGKAATYLLSVSTRLEDLIAEPVAALDAELASMRPTLGQWLDAFYWQFRCLQWGADTLSISDLLTWNWTPLLDRELIAACWPLKAAAKHSNRFAEAMTAVLAPQLAAVPYDKSAPALRADPGVATRAVGVLTRTVRAAVPSRFRRVLPPRSPTISPYADEALLTFWQQLFFGKGPHEWREFASSERVERLIEVNPSAEALWRLATIELFRRVDWV
jgi:asparagine synthase